MWRRYDSWEIFEILDHDLPEGDWVSNELAGLVESKYITNAIKLKKDSYKWGVQWFF